MGRPTILTPELSARICKLIADTGCSVEGAAAAAGVSSTSVFDWQARGRREPDTLYSEFAEGLQRARHRSEASLAQLVAKAAKKDWKAASWLLERRFPARYGNRVTVLNKFAQMTEDELDEFLAAESELEDALPRGEGSLGLPPGDEEETDAEGDIAAPDADPILPALPPPEAD